MKYTPENTNQETLQRETTYASVRAEFIPEYFTTANGDLVANTSSSAKSFWVVKLDQTGETYYFDNDTDADTFATNQGSVSDEYKSGYCYYNLFLNPNGNFQTLRNNFYQLRITSITGLGNPNPEDGGNEEKPVTRPANIYVDVDIQPWTVVLDDYDLY
ncbi:MAG: fimbria major subunit [Rikenellaceae bacterium]|nr:fimbria major subunit [Rikenellaceae bacterium]